MNQKNNKSPSYHNLFITTKDIPRISIFNLPFNLMVMCTRTGGWELWDTANGIRDAVLLAGEYDSNNPLRLDVWGEVIVDSFEKNDQPTEKPSTPEALQELDQDYRTLIEACNLVGTVEFFQAATPVLDAITRRGKELGCAFDSSPTLRWGGKYKTEVPK